MKLSIVSTMLLWLFATTLYATPVRSIKPDTIDKKTVVARGGSKGSQVFSRKAHISLANVGSDGLSVDEARFLEQSVVKAYESLVVDNKSVHMVKARAEGKSGVGNKSSGLRGLATTTRKKRSSASSMFIKKYSTTYRYDYTLFFDPTKCNCGSFWDRRLGSFSFSKLEGSKMATKLCEILRNGSRKVFHDVRQCQIVPF